MGILDGGTQKKTTTIDVRSLSKGSYFRAHISRWAFEYRPKKPDNLGPAKKDWTDYCCSVISPVKDFNLTLALCAHISYSRWSIAGPRNSQVLSLFYGTVVGQKGKKIFSLLFLLSALFQLRTKTLKPRVYAE